jgi:hypothetical protein
MEQIRLSRGICVVPARGSTQQNPLMMKIHHVMGVVGVVTVVPDYVAPMTMSQTVPVTTPLKAVMVLLRGKSQAYASQ